MTTLLTDRRRATPKRIGRASNKLFGGHSKPVGVHRKSVELALAATFKKAKHMGSDKLVGVVFHALRDVGIWPDVTRAPKDAEVEQLLSQLAPVIAALPPGEEADAARRNFALAHDRYAERKYGKAVAPLVPPPPPSAAQIARWEALIGA